MRLGLTDPAQRGRNRRLADPAALRDERIRPDGTAVRAVRQVGDATGIVADLLHPAADHADALPFLKRLSASTYVAGGRARR